MEINSAIELNYYGDFDIYQSKCVMVHKDEVLKEFLVSKGYVKLRTKEVCFSD